MDTEPVIELIDALERAGTPREEAQRAVEAVAAAAARAAAERMGLFVRAVIHDLKNPLGVVAGYIELLEAGVRGEMQPEQREWTARIRGVVDEMLALIADLLDLARIETGALDLDTQTVPLNAVLVEATELLRASAEAADVRLEVDVPADLPIVTGDPGRILQILEKLFDLILHSVAGGETARIEARAEERHGEPACVVGFRATAPVLVRALREKAPFEGMFRVDTAADRPPVTGMELALSRRIALLQDGDVRADADGDTVVLELRLPARRERRAARR